MNSVDRVWVMDPNARDSFEVTYWCDGFFFCVCSSWFQTHFILRLDFHLSQSFFSLGWYKSVQLEKQVCFVQTE